MVIVRRLALIALGLGALLFLINEVQKPRGEAHELERELNLGEKPTDLPVPGMPADEGGGLTHEIGGKA